MLMFWFPEQYDTNNNPAYYVCGILYEAEII